jgi:hypothetical protein
VNYELVYDAVTTSDAPAEILKFALGAVGLTALWAGWLRMKGSPLHGGVKMLGAIAVILLAVSLLSRYEQYTISRRTDVQTVEGPILGCWNKKERNKRADGSYSTTEWEGFSLNGVPFVYSREGQNYFHNGGKGSLELKDGLYLRLRYVSDGSTNQIIRVERGVLR